MNRIYVCHTYYNVYVSFLKELNYQKAGDRKGTIALSLMSTDFKDLKHRLIKSNIFDEVIELNEVHPSLFDEKFKYKIVKGTWWNPFSLIINWILYWRYIAKQTEKYINVDFSKYRKIFVYCDSDPIGMYLNYKKLQYTAVEDALESCRIPQLEKYIKFLRLKIILSKMGVIFMRDGFSKYAKELEVNDKEGIYSWGREVIGVSRRKLLNQLDNVKKELIYDLFYIGKTSNIFENCKKNVMLLAGQLCSPKKSFEIFKDIIKIHCDDYNVYIKPHPIDDSDYEKEFPECIILERFFPIEIFNIKCELEIEKLISVTTNLYHHQFAKEKIRLGVEFLDNYEDPQMLSQTSFIDKELIKKVED